MSTIRKDVQKLKAYNLKVQTCRIKLNQNESPYDLPAVLKEKALEAMKAASWNRYPTPFCDPLRKKIAQREGISEDGVLVSGGSNILIQAVIMATALEGKVMTVTPSFSLYEMEGALLGNKVVAVPLDKRDFSFPLKVFLKKMKAFKPQVVIIPNPNAPTGNLFSNEDLLQVIKAAPGLVVVDEAYYPFSGTTLAPHLKEYPNLVILRTLSKAFSLGGVRLGYLLADPTMALEIRKVMLPFSVGVLSQAVGEVVLDHDSYVKEIVAELVRERDVIYQTLKAWPQLRVHASAANFVLFQSMNSKKIFDELVKEEILIRDVSGSDLPHALRVSVGTPDENRAFLDVMKSIIS